MEVIRKRIWICFQVIFFVDIMGKRTWICSQIIFSCEYNGKTYLNLFSSRIFFVEVIGKRIGICSQVILKRRKKLFGRFFTYALLTCFLLKYFERFFWVFFLQRLFVEVFIEMFFHRWLTCFCVDFFLKALLIPANENKKIAVAIKVLKEGLCAAANQEVMEVRHRLRFC